jgi:hypothetical protein
MGERSLRRLRIIGASSFIIKRHVHAAARPGTWLGGMLTRKPPMLVRVALVNKMARIVWALMARGGVYRGAPAPRVRHRPPRHFQNVAVPQAQTSMLVRSLLAKTSQQYLNSLSKKRLPCGKSKGTSNVH